MSWMFQTNVIRTFFYIHVKKFHDFQRFTLGFFFIHPDKDLKFPKSSVIKPELIE